MAKALAGNTKIWESLSETDPSRTKEITGKKYRGTSINPNYIYEKLTEVFGPCGDGWGFRIADQGYEDSPAGKIHWVQIEFWHSSDIHIIIPAYGCTPFSGTYKSGPFVDEDAPKKSLTDALTKASQLIGMSADIFGGQWNDSKYVAELKEKYENGQQDNPEPSSSPAPAPSKVNYPNIAKEAESGSGAVDYPTVTDAQRKLLYAKFKSAGFTDPQMKEFLEAHFGIDSSKKFPKSEVNGFIALSDAGKLVPVCVEGDDDIPF
jgi:hypothetical protein